MTDGIVMSWVKELSDELSQRVETKVINKILYCHKAWACEVAVDLINYV